MTQRLRILRHRALALTIVVFAASVHLYGANTALAQPVLGNIVLKRTGSENPEIRATAVFPHWRHRMMFTCNVCHPAIFPMKGGETAVTMDDLQEGKYCGTCHNGKIAWGVGISTCARCHVPQ